MACRKIDRSSFLNPRSSGRDVEGEALERTHAFQIAILSVPAGKVSTYGKIAEAAGYPRYHRAVARLLSQEGFDELPWHRIVSADGTLRTTGRSADEQRARLRLEGVRLTGDKVDMSVFLYKPDRLSCD